MDDKDLEMLKQKFESLTREEFLKILEMPDESDKNYFDYSEEETKMSEPIVSCLECGGRACICEDGGKWAAHCEDCDNCVGTRGQYDPCCNSKEEAIIEWNVLNKGVPE